MFSLFLPPTVIFSLSLCVSDYSLYLFPPHSFSPVPPSVSLLQKTPSSPVTCHATGFYPSGVMVSWQKDGQDHHEDVEYGETLQNDDGTFQKSSHLTVTPEEWKNNKYQCVVQVTGVKEDFIKVLTESEIQTNWGKREIELNIHYSQPSY